MSAVRLEHRRGRWWSRGVEAESGRGWGLDREALAGLRLLPLEPDAGPVELAPEQLPLLDEAERAPARRRALVLLGHRARSVAELRRLLAAWPFNPEAVEDALGWVAQLGYLDDRALAQEMVALHLHRRTKGRRGVVAEMAERGIPADVATQEVERHYPAAAEYEVALELARRHARTLEGLPPERRLARLWRYLARRGFEEETVRRALREVLGPEASGGVEPA
ncbi:MAG: regulatory protein RecX [Firmicutes bacterium]|nr:regulatory protein RecX [Bacillota bacterium]